MRISLLVLALLLVCVEAAHADCSAQSRRPRLVELYTSEGCSSCPPADAWLRGLTADGGSAVLAFHVDYWDSLGWKDRFADARFTSRQQQQAARDGGSSVYTPQVVLDGRSWSGWYRGDASLDPVAAAAAMQVTITPGAGLHVRVATKFDNAADRSGFANYLALTEDGLATAVRAGENRGARLLHDHVVRALAGPLPLAEADADIAVPADVDLSRARVVAFAQRASDGAVAQVVVCRPGTQ